MKKQIIFFGSFMIFFLVALSGCFNNESTNEIDKFVGIWNQGETDLGHVLSDFVTINFATDKTFTSKEDGTYAVNNNSLVLTFGDEEKVWKFKYIFSKNNQKLTLIDSNELSVTFTKQ